MATAPSLIPIEEYMHTSYSPDCEYIDGLIVERNVGQGKHAYAQGKIRAEALGLEVQLSDVLPQ